MKCYIMHRRSIISIRQILSITCCNNLSLTSSGSVLQMSIFRSDKYKTDDKRLILLYFRWLGWEAFSMWKIEKSDLQCNVPASVIVFMFSKYTQLFVWPDPSLNWILIKVAVWRSPEKRSVPGRAAFGNLSALQGR